MQVDEKVRKSVVFLEFKSAKDHKIRPAGTAFLVSYPSAGLGDRVTGPPPTLDYDAIYRADRHGYLVTAGHVLRGVHEKSRDRQVIVRFNSLGSGGLATREFDLEDWTNLLPLEQETPDPNRAVKDVAVLPFNDRADLDLLDVPLEAAAFQDRRADAHIGVADDLFVTGLFGPHLGKKRNIPILRTGTIAAMPEEPIYSSDLGGSMNAYLIETHSLGGLSGSPVFAHLHGPRQVGPKSFNDHKTPEYYLMGLVGGHWDLNPNPERFFPELHSGVSYVVPVETIVEALVIAAPKARAK